MDTFSTSSELVLTDHGLTPKTRTRTLARKTTSRRSLRLEELLAWLLIALAAGCTWHLGTLMLAAWRFS